MKKDSAEYGLTQISVKIVHKALKKYIKDNQKSYIRHSDYAENLLSNLTNVFILHLKSIWIWSESNLFSLFSATFKEVNLFLDKYA